MDSPYDMVHGYREYSFSQYSHLFWILSTVLIFLNKLFVYYMSSLSLFTMHRFLFWHLNPKMKVTTFQIQKSVTGLPDDIVFTWWHCIYLMTLYLHDGIVFTWWHCTCIYMMTLYLHGDIVFTHQNVKQFIYAVIKSYF